MFPLDLIELGVSPQNLPISSDNNVPPSLISTYSSVQLKMHIHSRFINKKNLCRENLKKKEQHASLDILKTLFFEPYLVNKKCFLVYFSLKITI